MQGPDRSVAYAGDRFVPNAHVALTQLQGGILCAERTVIDMGPVRVARRAFNLPVRCRGTVALGTHVVGLLASPKGHVLWNGVPIGFEDLAATRSSIDFCTSAPSELYTIAAIEGLRWLDIPGEGVQIRTGTGVAKLRNVLRAAFSNNMPEETPWAIIDRLIAAFAAIEAKLTTIQPTHCQTRRVAAVRACQAYIAEHASEALTLRELSSIAGLRPRSLINAFEAVTGLSPMSFLRIERLNRVREGLLTRHRSRVRVIDVAAEWGFWHMGHFAATYRAMFGESPSETLTGAHHAVRATA